MSSQAVTDRTAQDSAGLQPVIQQQTSPVDSMPETSVPARNTPASVPGRSGSAFKQTGHPQQRSGQGLTSLQSPFATSDVQHATAQPEQTHSAPVRKRTRCQSTDLDSKPLSKIPHLAHRQHNLTAVAAPDSSVVTIHKPTPKRPSAATPCCFGVVSAAQPLQHTQLKPSSLNAPQPNPAVQPAAVPSSLATAPNFANASAVSKLPETAPAVADKGSPSRPERSQELKTTPGPAASDSSEVVSDNSQQMSAQPHVSHIQASASIPNLAHICAPPSIQHIQTPAFTPSSYLQTQHLLPNQQLLHSNITPFTTYSCPTANYSAPGSLPNPTTYVVVSGNSPKRSADKYVAAVVQDAQGNSQHVTVAASAISTGGPSYVLPTTLAVPFTPLNPMITQQALAFGSAGLTRPQHILAPGPFGQSLAGLGPVGLGPAGALSAMAFGLPNGFSTTQAGYNLLPQVPPAMIPSIQVSVQDKASCVVPPTNVRIY